MEGWSSNIPRNTDEAALTKSIDLEISQLHNTETQGFISRVIEPLRSVNSKAYEPDILAIGPYHHGKDKYKMMETHKLRYLQSILNRKGENNAGRYISVVSKLEKKARSCYAEPINLNQANFIKMLVLDGCFIIELALKFHNTSYRYLNDPIFTVIRNSLMKDTILFENQIPFFILLELFDLIEGPGQHDTLVDLLLEFCRALFPDNGYRKPTYTDPFNIKHWLDPNTDPSDVKHLLDLIYSCWTPKLFEGAVDVNNYTVQVNSESILIPSVTELKDANVKFKKNEKCVSLFDVKFEHGTLLIPPLIVSDETEPFLRNLVAYEQYFLAGGNNYITAYLKFMDHLINSSKDVDVLTKCGIIYNWMGDHEVIARMFNKLGDWILVYFEHAYGQTFKDINTYRNKSWNRWIAVLNQDYFSSPWGLISIFAAFVLLTLTLIQAVCSIIQAYEPAIVAIGSYHHDKESCKMMEQHKWRSLRLCLNHKKEATAERYISAIGELEQEERNCYAEPFTLGQENFIDMLVLTRRLLYRWLSAEIRKGGL